jgi:hypothetical protein
MEIGIVNEKGMRLRVSNHIPNNSRTYVGTVALVKGGDDAVEKAHIKLVIKTKKSLCRVLLQRRHQNSHSVMTVCAFQ